MGAFLATSSQSTQPPPHPLGFYYQILLDSMERTGFFVCLLLIVLAAVVSLHETNALYVKSGNKLTQALKRSAASELKPARQKRYGDYQERASAFCTGLCMYEERKSYSECFDACSYYW